MERKTHLHKRKAVRLGLVLLPLLGKERRQQCAGCGWEGKKRGDLLSRLSPSRHLLHAFPTSLCGIAAQFFQQWSLLVCGLRSFVRSLVRPVGVSSILLLLFGTCTLGIIAWRALRLCVLCTLRGSLHSPSTDVCLRPG